MTSVTHCFEYYISKFIIVFKENLFIKLLIKYQFFYFD